MMADSREQVSSSPAKWCKSCRFRLGGERVRRRHRAVQEIIRMVEITRVPRAPHFMEGVINLRGQLIPIIDLRTRFAWPGIEKDQEQPHRRSPEIGTKRVGICGRLGLGSAQQSDPKRGRRPRDDRRRRHRVHSGRRQAWRPAHHHARPQPMVITTEEKQVLETIEAAAVAT